VCVCVTLLLFSGCTKDGQATAPVEMTLQSQGLPAGDAAEIAQLLKEKPDEPNESGRVLAKDCRCYLKVLSATNIGANNSGVWGLADITYTRGTNNIPEMAVDGSEGAWLYTNPFGVITQEPLPSPYFELSTPSSGAHILQLYLFGAGTGPNSTLGVTVVCVNQANGGFALANQYHYNLVFSEGRINPDKGTAEFDIVVGCNNEDGYENL